MSAEVYALSLWQPWAYAVCHLGKRIENRSAWHEGTPALSTARRLVGSRILIHAAKGSGTRAEFTAAIEWMLRGRLAEGAAIRGPVALECSGRDSQGPYHYWQPAASLPRMALVARATLAAVVHTTIDGHRWDAQEDVCKLCGGQVRHPVLSAPPRCPKADPWAIPGVGLVLADVETLPAPVRYAGRQGWFRVPASAIGGAR